MTEIGTLFDLGLSDSMIASRLGVNRSTVHRWRRGAQPRTPVQLKARAYLAEVFDATRRCVSLRTA